MNFKTTIIIYIACFVLSGCKNSFDEPFISAGNADFTRFVSLGGYYAAGYGDGALHLDVQQNSFPSILAGRFKLVGGGEFKQPLVNPGAGLGYDQNNNPVSKWGLYLQNDCSGDQSLVINRGSADLSNLTYIGGMGHFNNLGIPGAKTFDLFSDAFGRELPLGNPYFHRFANNNTASSTVLGDAQLINCTFFVLWVGNEDVWQYAKSGGLGDFTNDTLDIKTNDITPLIKFQLSYDFILKSISAGNKSKGAIANIPDISCFPFYTAIPYNGLILTQAEADTLNAKSAGVYNFKEGANAYIVSVKGASNPRQLKKGEYVLFSAPKDSLTCYGLGTPQAPIPHQYILDSAEVANIRSATVAFNAKIANAAAAYNLAYVDMNGFFQQYRSGQIFNGVNYSTEYLRNSIFSLDGLYPNSRGHAHIANAFIRAINGKYMSTLPEVDANSYDGVIFP